MLDTLQKPGFKRIYKKLTPDIKSAVNEAIEVIQKNPDIGELKKGNLAGLRVYKFKIHQQQKLLAYTVGQNAITLLTLGTHENFYRDLKTK